MKRMVGIFFLALLCILLGLSVEWLEGETTLVSSYEYRIGGEYD